MIPMFKRIAQMIASAMSIVPQNAGHHSGIQGFGTRCGCTRKSNSPCPAIANATIQRLMRKPITANAMNTVAPIVSVMIDGVEPPIAANSA